MKLKEGLNYFRQSNSDKLPLNQRFWLYFFIVATVILALISGYLTVKLEKLTTICDQVQLVKESAT